MVSGPLGRSYHKEEMSKLWEVDYIECLFSFCKKMQKLELSYKEIAMLKCVVLTFAGRFTTGKVSGLEVRKLEYSLRLKIKPNVSASSQSLGFNFNLRMNSSFITTRPGVLEITIW